MIQDMEYLTSMYPEGMKKIQQYVSEACDQLEYKNSPMFDEFPEILFINKISESISNTISSIEGLKGLLGQWKLTGEEKNQTNPVDEISEYQESYNVMESGLEVQQIGWREFWPGSRPQPPRPHPPGPQPPRPQPPRPQPPRPQPPGPPPRPLPSPPNTQGNSAWLNDMVKVMLLNEMFKRRCRYGMYRY